MEVGDIQARAAALMPGLIDDLRILVSHGSIAFPGHPEAPVRAAAAATVDVLVAAGFTDVRILDQPEGFGPVYAEMAGPPGAPTVLLYAHYDVQPAPIEAGWTSDPFTLTERDGRLYGRGAADDKSGIVIHAGAMRIFDGHPPVGIKVVIEGEEETLSHLEALVEAEPERFRADVMVIADMGNLVAGEPVLTTTLRGDVMCLVEATTLDQPVHSGIFGGAAPDAMVALVHVLSALWDEDGRTVVPGLHRYEWPGAEFAEREFRTAAGVADGVGLPGRGTISTRLWSQPSATVLGLDTTSVDRASNVLIPSARAKVGMRIAPGADAARELELLAAFLRARAPRWASITVTPIRGANAFVVPAGGPAVEAARDALREAYGREPSEIGSGGSIPLLQSLHEAAPDAEFILWGAEDIAAAIHGPNESVDPTEIERMVVAEALLLSRLGARR